MDIRNNADQMVYQMEKALEELGDKMDSNDKSEIQTKLDALKEALKGTNLEEIKSKQDDLQKKFYEVSAKVYQQQAPSGAPQQDGGAASGNDGADYVDADFKEVDDDNK